MTRPGSILAIHLENERQVTGRHPEEAAGGNGAPNVGTILDDMAELHRVQGHDDPEESESPEVPPEPEDSIPADDPRQEQLLNRLLYKGVLPRYAFPTNVAALYIFNAERNKIKARSSCGEPAVACCGSML